MKRHSLWPLLLPVAAIGFIALLLGLSSWLGQKGVTCLFQEITGLHCPGCGGTRCAHDLVAGNWHNALDHNALLAVGAFAFGGLCIYLIVRVTILGQPAPRLPTISTKWMWVTIILLALFTVLRNIPAWPFSLLAP